MHHLRPLVVTTIILLLGACGSGDDRPSAAEWQPRWEAARGVLPSAETLTGDGEDVCGGALGDLRAAREELVDTPRPVLDDSVSDWVGEAEALLLECPSEEDEVAERLEDLEVLAAEVDAGLEASETG